jgi:hypothetical protein
MRFADIITRRWMALRQWARDGRPLWWWIAIASLILGVCYMAPVELIGVEATVADRVRWAGMVLQFAELGVVVLGLHDSRKQFGRPAVLSEALGWLLRLRFVAFPRKTVFADATIVLEGVGSAAGVGQPTVAISEATLESRVATLERKHAELQRSVGTLGHDLATLRDRIKSDLDQERRARADKDREIVAQIETAVIGGIHLELSGLGYLVAGILLATTPDEVAFALRWIGF